MNGPQSCKKYVQRKCYLLENVNTPKIHNRPSPTPHIKGIIKLELATMACTQALACIMMSLENQHFQPA